MTPCHFHPRDLTMRARIAATAMSNQQANQLTETKYWVAFNRIGGIGRVRYQAMLAHFGSLSRAWVATRSELTAAGLDQHAVRLISDRRDAIDPAAEMETLLGEGITPLTWEDQGYPARLKEIGDPPPVLYIRGNLAASDDLAVAVVGTRRPTPYGRQVAEEMAQQLAANRLTIVSGLARGVDAIAHRAALQTGGRTIAVMACGLDMVYPPEHARLSREVSESGVLISEQPLGTQPRGDYFPRRNRILSGLSLGVLVIEADHKSGAMITAREALDNNREVFAIPGSVFSPQSRGTNAAIQRGEAKLVLTVEDILEELNLTSAPQQIEMQELVPPTDTEAQVLRHLSREAAHINDVCRISGLPAATVSSLLAMMELKGIVKQTAPAAYVRAR
jgi:DNA processing protein